MGNLSDAHVIIFDGSRGLFVGGEEEKFPGTLLTCFPVGRERSVYLCPVLKWVWVRFGRYFTPYLFR